MPDAIFHLVCAPGILQRAPEGWVEELLEVGELALLPDAGGLAAITAVAHDLQLITVPLLRPEATAELQQQTVMAHAGSRPLVWIAEAFTDAATVWAHERGPMTLLVPGAGPLTAQERGRVERFVVILGRQAE